MLGFVCIMAALIVSVASCDGFVMVMLFVVCGLCLCLLGFISVLCVFDSLEVNCG